MLAFLADGAPRSINPGVSKVARYFQAILKDNATPRTGRAGGLDKFQRYRASRRASGIKPLCVWVPDPNAPGFREEARRQAMTLRGASEELEALDFIEATADWVGAGS
jgi:hypothetical protein